VANSDKSDLSRATGGEVLPLLRRGTTQGTVGDEEQGDENIQAAYPLKDLFGIRREKVTGARVGIEDEKKCGERYKPNGEPLPCRERLWGEKEDEKHDCECPHAAKKRISNFV